MKFHATRLCLLVTFLLGIAISPCFAADWPAIAPDDKALTSVPQQPGAPAVVLYREEITDDTKNFRTVFVRIKVLTEAGNKYADVEIPCDKQSFTISQLSGRTVHADGSIVTLEDQPVDKIVIKEHGVRARVKAFTLPAVQVGSILDYRYSLHFPEGSKNAPEWTIQSHLFAKKVAFKFTPYKYQPQTESLRGSSAVSSPIGGGTLTASSPTYQHIGSGMNGQVANGYNWIHHLPAGNEPQLHMTQQALNEWVDLEMSDVPAAIDEPLMPPAENTQWRVSFFYQEQQKSDIFWKNAGKAWNKNVENFIDKKNGVMEAVNQLAVPSDTPETKVRKIYAAISQFENQSFAPVSQQLATLPANAGVEDVLRQHRGSHDELNRLFVAMARAAGIPAWLMWVPDRGRTAFDPAFMSTDQLDGEIAIVQLDGKEVFLDPATKFCPYGILNWHYAGSRGLRQNNDKSTELADSPAPNYKQASIQRVARLQLAANGMMQGTLAIGFSGQEAMVRRQRGMSLDAEGRKKLLEEEIRSWLPSGSQVTLTNTPDWNQTEGLLVAKLTVSGPLASKADQGRNLPVHIFHGNEQKVFSSDQRSNAVYLEFASRQIDEVHIVLPPNVDMNAPPPDNQIKRDYALYTSAQNKEGTNGIVATRDLAMNGVLFPPAEYKELKDFYDKVKAADDQPAVLNGSLQTLNN